MGFQEATGFCETCERQVMVHRKTANHVLHLLLTVFLGAISFGIGAIVWILVWFLAAMNKGPWRCINCGRHTNPGPPKNVVPEKKPSAEPDPPTVDADDDQPNVYVIE